MNADERNKISVIVPVYNVEKYVYKCLDSICNNTYKNIEVIVVNDGSTDNSLSVCEEYSKIDGRVRVYSKENGGLSSARNFGVSLAIGDYLMYVDSDDFIDENMLKTMIYYAEKNNADIVQCGYSRIGEDGIIKSVRKCKYEVLSNKKDIYDAFSDRFYYAILSNS